MAEGPLLPIPFVGSEPGECLGLFLSLLILNFFPALPSAFVSLAIHVHLIDAKMMLY